MKGAHHCPHTFQHRHVSFRIVLGSRVALQSHGQTSIKAVTIWRRRYWRLTSIQLTVPGMTTLLLGHLSTVRTFLTPFEDSAVYEHNLIGIRPHEQL